MTVDVVKGGKLVTYKVLTPPANLVETFPLAMEQPGGALR